MIYDPPHPGVVFKDLYMEPIGASCAEMSEMLRVPSALLENIINGNHGVSSNMAIRIGKAFDCSPASWARMQADYDVWQAMQEYSADDVDRVEWGEEHD